MYMLAVQVSERILVFWEALHWSGSGSLMLVWIREGDICFDGRGSQSVLRREESVHPSKLISAKAAVLRVVC